MDTKLNLDLSLGQKQILSQRMQLSLQILQMNSLDLEQYIRDATIENPVLELEAFCDVDGKSEREKKLEWLNSMDETSLYKYTYSYGERENEQPLYEKKTVDSLEDTLAAQLLDFNLPPVLERTVRYLIGTLDQNGYLTASHEQLAHDLNTDVSMIASAVAVLHRMEPAGVGAMDLRECLLIQAKRLKDPQPELIELIDKHLDTLAKNQFDKLARVLRVSLDRVKEMRRELLELNPKPGNGYSSYNSIPFIRPDLFIVRFEGEFRIIPNAYNEPQVLISRYYRGIMKDCSPEVAEYIRDRLAKAEWLVSCVEQRKKTLLRCAEQVLRWQIRFFENGPGNIVPMSLADIASQLDIHPSTVSRAVSGKYLQCQWGLFGFCNFFSRAVSENQQNQSQDTVVCVLKQIIDREDKSKPLSDQQLTEVLQQSGISVARRTVAKYREHMQIPSASRRKAF